MELPHPLRHAIDGALTGIAVAELATAVAALSQRYRDERRDGTLHVTTQAAALAYLAVRLPATYAAARASFDAVAEVRPDFVPRTLLDVGAGPGTVLWATADCWPGLVEALLIEANPILRAYGERLSADAPLPPATWRSADITAARLDCAPHDLVVLAYLLNELAPEARPEVLERLWRLTADSLIVVEPGTPTGWQRILAARSQLVALGAHVVAPCPHAGDCPLRLPDWCHFSRRVARSRVHRQAKEADVPWEDEKFSYVALSRRPAASPSARVIGSPRKASGRVTLKLCRGDGTAGEQLFSRRDGTAFKQARRSDWGAAL